LFNYFCRDFRWGWIITALSTQGSSFLATLGYGRNPVGIEP
jgi:hypothetical protein